MTDPQSLSSPAPSPEASALARECLEAIQEALKLYGEHSYYDRGADNVMDTPRFVRSFRKLPPELVAETLALVLREEHGFPFCEDAMRALDGLSKSEWESLVARYPELAELRRW